jgi:hypothetical protein
VYFCHLLFLAINTQPLLFNVTAKMSEGDYVDKICTGSIEYTLDNKTRVDCQLANESQEYDWQNKH